MKLVRTVAVAVVAVAALGACSSNPNAKAVALDVAKSLGLPAAQQDCLVAKLEAYPADDLEQLGEANLDIDFNAENPAAQGDAAYQRFVTDLESCS